MGSMAERRRGSRLMTPKTPRFWPEMKMRRGFCASWPRYPYEIAKFGVLKRQILAISNAPASEKQTPAQSLRGLFTDDCLAMGQ